METSRKTTTIVIAGATGDLTQRKLLPALLKLHARRVLPETLQLLCVARSLFIRNDQIEEAWRIVDPLLAEASRPGATHPFVYERGSWGPKEADDLLAATGRRWLYACGGHHAGAQ